MDSTLLLDQRAFLATSRASTPIIRAAWAFGLVSLAFFVAVLPVAGTPLGPVSSFVPVYTAILVLCDLITSVILFGQYTVAGNRGVLFLAAGYLFTASITTAYALVFPGFFAPAGLFDAGPQTTSAMYMLWHAGFPVLVITYSLTRSFGPPNEIEDSGRKRRGLFVLLAVASVLLGVTAYTAFAAEGNALLPLFLVSNVTTALGKTFLSIVWAFSFAAFFVLWFRRPFTVLDVWLLFVMQIWIFDIALSAVFNGGRYDLGWYFGRVYGLLGASFLLVILLTEFVSNYGKLFELSNALQRANHALKELSLHDGLTGLANRRSFDQYLLSQFSLAKRQQRPLCLILCDIDHFKLFNDSFGHLVGDDCLRRVAQVLKEMCRRPSDRACRYGGEEFALVLPDTDLEGARTLAEAIRTSIETLRIAHGSGGGVEVRLSLGIARLQPKSATAEDLIREADAALYRAKQQGRNRVVIA